MAPWLNRRLDVDLSTVDSGKDKRKKKTDEEHYLLWLLLVPASCLPSPDDLRLVLTALSSAGFTLQEEHGMHTVCPADVVDDENVYSTRLDVAIQLASEGGGVFFNGRGTGIALVCDPQGITRGQVIRRTGLQDAVQFGEFSIWMPRPEQKGLTHNEAAAAILAILPRVQELLKAACCFVVTTDDLATLFIRWPYHRLLAETNKLGELFWYQWFSADLSDDIPLDGYGNAGCTVETPREGGVTIQLTELPSIGLAKLDGARDRWPYSMIPRRVC